MSTNLTYGSLFTGVGGLDMGFDQHGYRCQWQAENNPHCQQTLAHHWPHVKRHTDVRGINGTDLTPVDIITYGSPCQDLSTAGRQHGLTGNKSQLFFEATRIIKEMRHATNNTHPRIALWENVPGALTSNNGRDFQTVLTELENIGAVFTEWAVLDTINFGIPQRRRRLFAITIFDTDTATRCPDPLFPLKTSHHRPTPTTQTVAFYRTHGKRDQPQQDISPPPQSHHASLYRNS